MTGFAVDLWRGGLLAGRPSAPDQLRAAGALHQSREAGVHRERPERPFRKASLKKTSGAPGCQARSIKAEGPRRRKKKGASVRGRAQKPFSGQSDYRVGARVLTVRLNRVGSQAVGAPPGQKGLSAGEGNAPGLVAA